MTARYVDGRVEFDVPHFSNYVIVYDAEKAAACPKDDTCPISAFPDADPTAWYHDGVRREGWTSKFFDREVHQIGFCVQAPLHLL